MSTRQPKRDDTHVIAGMPKWVWQSMALHAAEKAQYYHRTANLATTRNEARGNRTAAKYWDEIAMHCESAVRPQVTAADVASDPDLEAQYPAAPRAETRSQ